MCSQDSHMEVGILEVHIGHTLKWLYGSYNGLQSLHLERCLSDAEVEVLQVQDGPVAPVSLGYQEVSAVEPLPLLVSSVSSLGGPLQSGDRSARTNKGADGSGGRQRGPPRACPKPGTDAVLPMGGGATPLGLGDFVTGSTPTHCWYLVGELPGDPAIRGSPRRIECRPNC